jgi:hypothetical protein
VPTTRPLTRSWIRKARFMTIARCDADSFFPLPLRERVPTRSGGG